MLRILSLNKFRDWLCKIKETRLLLGENGDVKIGGPCEIEEATSKEEEEKKEIDLKADEEKARMMKNMAQRWLEQEVQDLEGRGSGGRGTFGGFAHYSPYLVVDHLALTRFLNLVKEIVASKRFAVIIPSIGKHI